MPIALPDLIETHTAAVVRRQKAMHALMAPGLVPLADLDAYDHAADAEAAAVMELLAHPCRDVSDVSTKAAYLLHVVDRLPLERHHVKALLQSLIPAL